jgi:CHAD domain-containing protein
MRKLVRSQTARRLKKFEAELRGARKHTNAEAIHDLRVSIRRLSRALRVFREWFDAGEVKSIRRRLRKLMKRCAAVRNCDVAIEVLQAAGWPSPELAAGLEEERLRTLQDLIHALDAWRRSDRVRQWRMLLRDGHGGSEFVRQSAREHARRLLPAMAADLFRAGQEAAGPDSEHRGMHRFRLKTKRVRYTLELFETVYGQTTDPILQSLKGLQEKLGAINDCATTLEMVRRDRHAAAAVRRLAGAREVEFRTYWTKNFGPRELSRWKAVLDAADGKT